MTGKFLCYLFILMALVVNCSSCYADLLPKQDEKVVKLSLQTEKEYKSKCI